MGKEEALGINLLKCAKKFVGKRRFVSFLNYFLPDIKVETIDFMQILKKLFGHAIGLEFRGECGFQMDGRLYYLQ